MSFRDDDSQMPGAFGMLINAMGGGGDAGQSFPASDAADLSSGARFIPGEVTLERRAGKRVSFINVCTSQCCWYWELEDGTRIYHFSPSDYNEIGRHNNGADWNREGAVPAGPCPRCGNLHTNGGTVKQSDIA